MNEYLNPKKIKKIKDQAEKLVALNNPQLSNEEWLDREEKSRMRRDAYRDWFIRVNYK